MCGLRGTQSWDSGMRFGSRLHALRHPGRDPIGGPNPELTPNPELSRVQPGRRRKSLRCLGTKFSPVALTSSRVLTLMVKAVEKPNANQAKIQPSEHMKRLLVNLLIVAVLIGTTPSSIACDVPAGLSAGNITATSAILSWAPVSGADSYNVAWQKVNSA